MFLSFTKHARKTPSNQNEEHASFNTVKFNTNLQTSVTELKLPIQTLFDQPGCKTPSGCPRKRV